MASVRILFYIILFISVFGCTIKSSVPDHPDFNKDVSGMQKNMSSLVTCEHVNIDGQRITNNQTVSTLVEVDIINPIHIPSDGDSLKDLSKKIARVVRQNLRNNKQFENYQILYINQASNNGLITKSWKGNVLNFKEF